MKIVGHRGARGLAPENTLASIAKAIEHKVDMVEIDLRVTKDQVVVLHHNSYIKDPRGHKLKLKELTFAELKQHQPNICRLEEALRQIDAKVPYYLEVKPRVPTQPIIELLKSWPKNKLVLASKSQKTLKAIHKALPDLPLVVIEPWSGVRAHIRTRQLGADTIAMNQLFLWWGFIRSVSKGGMKLYAYTLNDRAKAKRWTRHGLYGVITDYPDRFC